MKSYKWIKLYHEILSDPNMGKMNDHLWRRTIEFFLIAGQVDKGGELPSIKDMAWILHTNEKDIAKCLDELEKFGIITKGEVTYVTNFEKRQESNLTSAEKVKRYRERLQNNNKIQSELVTNVTDVGYNLVTNVTDAEGILLPDKITNVSPRLREELREELKEDLIEEKNLSVPEKPLERKPKNKESFKKPYGEFKNVTLTDDEYKKLQERFPTRYGEWIEKLSTWKESKGKKTKSDYATILNWDRMEKEKKPEIKNELEGWILR